MADQTQITETNEPQDQKTSRIQDFITKHPRAARVAGITAAAAGVIGVVAVVKNCRKDDASGPAVGEEVIVLDPDTETYKVTEA